MTWWGCGFSIFQFESFPNSRDEWQYWSFILVLKSKFLCRRRIVDNSIIQGCQQLLIYIICVWGALKGPKSNFIPVHFALYFGNFTLMVLKLILASKLSEIEQFENRAANNQIARKRVKIRPKSNRCYCQALEQMFLGWVMLTWNETPLKIQFYYQINITQPKNICFKAWRQ